jgi:lysophospholipase L1-like esterase
MKYKLHLLVVAAIFFLQPPRPARAEDKAAAGVTKIACVGDSITYGAGIKDREHNSYPAQLQTLLGKNYQVRNFGVNGATLLKKGDNPYWKTKAFEEAKNFAPDVVVIKLGTNDTKPQNWAHKDEYAADFKAMVEEFAALPSKPKIFLCHPVPAFPGNWGIRDEVIKNEVIPLVDQVAKETGATVIDLYTALADSKALFPDKVHPNAQGAKMMADVIAKAVTAKAAVKH